MKILDLVLDTKLVNWVNLRDLQPDNLKLPYNLEHLKKSLLKNGFSMPFYGWENKGEVYIIDGHTRKQVLLELIADGVEVPELLPCTFIEAKNKKEAVIKLTEVFNQKSNPIDGNVLEEWVINEEWEMQDFNFEGVNMFTEIKEGEQKEENQSKKSFDVVILCQDIEDQSEMYNKAIADGYNVKSIQF